jgi:putative hemolysin
MRLRFQVFHLELGAGLASSLIEEKDEDAFDAICDHLLVEELAENQQTGCVVGTYRMQSGLTALGKLGYYSAREFDLTPYEQLRPVMLELGRACIHREHRSMQVLMLLWRGIIDYAQRQSLRYLIGCSSLTGTNPADGAVVYRSLQNFLAPPEMRTVPRPAFALPLEEQPEKHLDPPKLLRAYLAMGACICGPPALDAEFGSIDFLTLMDLACMSPAGQARFLR